jgi:hypothetical protein
VNNFSYSLGLNVNDSRFEMFGIKVYDSASKIGC